MKVKEYKRILEHSDSVDGIFTLGDLRVLYADCSPAALYRRIQDMLEMGELRKVKRGLYAVPGASLLKISQRLEPESYVSTGTVLASKGLIGSVPMRRVQAVKIGKSRVYSTSLGTIEHLGVLPHLMFGFEWNEGVRQATVEKAYVDCWYFRCRGKSFSFDLLEDVDLSRLNTDLISGILSSYDQRFRSYLWTQAGVK